MIELLGQQVLYNPLPSVIQSEQTQQKLEHLHLFGMRPAAIKQPALSYLLCLAPYSAMSAHCIK